jgi:hypothetical protein
MFEDPTAALPFDKASHKFFESLARNPTGMTATALVRADIYEDARLLELMKEAGVTNLSVGIESLSDQTRSDFKKNISYNIIRKSMDIFHEHGFTITGLFIVGYDTDDLDTFQRIRHFISDTGIEKWRISPLSQMLESTDEFMAAHRYFLWDEFHHFGREVADYCNGEFVIFYPKHMKPSTLQKKIMEFNLSLASLPNIVRLFGKCGNLRSVFQRLGNHLAHRMMVKEIAASKYIEMVQKVEGEFYIECNGNEYLHEEFLLTRYKEKIRTQQKEKQALEHFGTCALCPVL